MLEEFMLLYELIDNINLPLCGVYIYSGVYIVGLLESSNKGFKSFESGDMFYYLNLNQGYFNSLTLPTTFYIFHT